MKASAAELPTTTGDDRGDELRRLIAEQADDDRADRLPADRRILRECDLDAQARRRSGGRARFDLRDCEPARRRASKFRGRSRRVAIRDDAGRWHDTSVSGVRPSLWVLIEGCAPWEGAVQAAVDRGLCECPACHDLADKPPGPGRPSRAGHICLYCNAAGLDPLVASGKLELWGVAVDSVLNPIASQYKARATRYTRTARGGTG